MFVFRQVQWCMMKLLGMEDMRQIEACSRNSGNFTKFTLASICCSNSITVEI